MNIHSYICKLHRWQSLQALSNKSTHPVGLPCCCAKLSIRYWHSCWMVGSRRVLPKPKFLSVYRANLLCCFHEIPLDINKPVANTKHPKLNWLKWYLCVVVETHTMFTLKVYRMILIPKNIYFIANDVTSGIQRKLCKAPQPFKQNC